MVRRLTLLCYFGLALTASLRAHAEADVPGGQTRTAAMLPARSYELLVSPAFLFSGQGATYLSSKIRYQPLERLNVGFGFGSGEVGFNVGAEAFWELFPQTVNQPAFGLLGAVNYNRIAPYNYVVMRVAPIVSWEVPADFGSLTPYAGLHVAPSFALSPIPNTVAARIVGGSQFRIKALEGLRLWTELGLNLSQSVSELVMGISYPFAAI